MAEDDAAKTAQRNEIKALVKEAITEYITEETSKRTAAGGEGDKAPKAKKVGFFDSIFDFGG